VLQGCGGDEPIGWIGMKVLQGDSRERDVAVQGEFP